MPAEASLAATDAPITPAPITTQRRDPTETMTPTVGGSHQAGKPRERSYSPPEVRAGLAAAAAAAVARYAGSNIRLGLG